MLINLRICGDNVISERLGFSNSISPYLQSDNVIYPFIFCVLSFFVSIFIYEMAKYKFFWPR